MSLAKKGRAFMEAHSNCKPVDLVENCGFALPYAKTFWYEEKRKLFNKEHLKNRPKRKLIGSSKPQKPTVQPPVKPIDWEQNYRLALAHVQKLEKYITEHKAVIGYLERFIEKRYGSSV